MYHLQIVTPEKIVFDEKILSLIVSGDEGYLGVLTDHAPLVSSLKEGVLVITDKNKRKVYYRASSGFLEVANNHVTVLVERIESTDPVDIGTQGVV